MYIVADSRINDLDLQEKRQEFEFKYCGTLHRGEFTNFEPTLDIQTPAEKVWLDPKNIPSKH